MSATATPAKTNFACKLPNHDNGCVCPALKTSGAVTTSAPTLAPTPTLAFAPLSASDKFKIASEAYLSYLDWSPTDTIEEAKALLVAVIPALMQVTDSDEAESWNDWLSRLSHPACGLSFDTLDVLVDDASYALNNIVEETRHSGLREFLTENAWDAAGGEPEIFIGGTPVAIFGTADFNFPGGHGTTLQGGRDYQQDGLAAGSGFAIVADGMGGHRDGELASAAVIRSLLADINPAEARYNGFTPEQMIEAIEKAGNAARALGENRMGSHDDPGSTVVISVRGTDVENGEQQHTVGWCGDSRVYHIDKDGDVTQITVDHTTYDPYYRQWVLGSCLGGGVWRPQIEAVKVTLAKGERLLLCSDGFYDAKSKESEMMKARIGGAAIGGKTGIRNLALEQASLPGADNVSVIVIENN
jgi:PPM family protein phosphatase